MRKNFKWLLALVAMVASVNLMAGVITFTPDSKTSTSSASVSPISFAFTDGSTATKWYDDGLRFYEGATITVSSENTITQIEFTHGASNNGCLVLDGSSTGTYSSMKWTGSAKSIKFKVTHSSGTKNGQVKLTQVKVTYEGTAKTLTSIAISGNPTKTTYEAGETFDPAGLVVTGTYDDKSEATITDGIEWTITPSPLTAGTTSVSVTAKVGEVTSEAYQVNGLTVNAIEGDRLTLASTGVSGSTYNEWSGKTGSEGVAVYAGKCAGGNSSIQLNTTNPQGLVSTTSGGLIRKVKVDWNSNTSSTGNRSIDIYGSNTAYTGSGDIYDTEKQGTKLGSIVCGTSTELVVEGDYEYVGVRAIGGALYINSITFVWSAPVPVPATLEGIVIKGEASKLEYFVGEAFDPAGLEVWGIYTKTVKGDSTSQIKSGFEWSIAPEVLAKEDISVDVTAQYKDFTSEVFTVNNIVVKAKPAAKYVPVAWNEIEDGGKYFITAADGKEYYFAAKTFAAGKATAIAFDASMASEADMWVFTKNGNTWKISTTDSAGLYMTNANNGLVCAADKGADFTVAQGSSAEFTYLTASDGTNTRYVSLYNQQDFRCYKTSSPSGIYDLKLYGLKKEGVVTKPSFTPSEGEFDGSVEVTLTADEGADIYYAINEEVTSMNAIKYTEPIDLIETTTIYAVAKKDGKESEQVSKTYTKIPVFESLEDLVTNLPATDKNVTVIVTITEAKIDSFYVTSQKQTNGVYTHAGETVVELYEYNVPKAWEVGGTLSATTLKAQWSLYKGTAELQKWEGGWTVFTYTAPQPTDINNVKANAKATKAIVNGQIVIIRDNKTYNVLGF